MRARLAIRRGASRTSTAAESNAKFFFHRPNVRARIEASANGWARAACAIGRAGGSRDSICLGENGCELFGADAFLEDSQIVIADRRAGCRQAASHRGGQL